MEYSTKEVTSQLLEEIKNALQSVSYGSIEIYIADDNVTQITTRTIKKTSITMNQKSERKSKANGKSKKYLVGPVPHFKTADSSTRSK